MSEKKKFRGPSGLLIFLCLFFCVLFGAINNSQENKKAKNTQTLVTSSIPSTPTQRPASNKNSTAVPTKEIPTSKTDLGRLPGLLPADVTVNLEKIGFSCGSVEEGDLYYTRDCKKEDLAIYTMFVTIYGSKAFTVDFIESTILQYGIPSLELASPFLEFMATMPYSGSDPIAAKAWIKTTLTNMKSKGFGQEANTEINGVKFHLFGIDTALTLEMGELK